ncbi:MAG: sigma-54 interaction domain-containing protein [Bacillota bacterium]
MIKNGYFNTTVEGKKLLDNNIWKQIVNSMDAGIHIIDQRGITILYNQTASELDGLKPEEVLNKNIFEVFPSLTFENSTLMQTLTTRSPINDKEQTFVNNKGHQVTTVNKTVPLTFADGKQGAMEISRDITYIHELVENVTQLRNKFNSKGKTNAQEVQDNNTSYTFADLIGENHAFKAQIKNGIRAARSNSAVLIIGETGTGKELFAQGIHNASPRADAPFIAQNCAALPRNLLEGLLFGTEKGSFTGAQSRPGLFEQAEGGTILLDEINSLDCDLQAKLLRVVQEGKVRRVGGKVEKPVDVRIVTTMNQNPDEAFAAGTLRQDLFYRLSVVCLELPPLRNRTDDIPILIDHFIKQYNQKFNLNIEGVSKNLLSLLKDYNWPGNVRELQHMLEGGFNLCQKGSCLKLAVLPQHLQQKLKQNNFKPAASSKEKFQPNFSDLSGEQLPALQDHLEEIEISLIERALTLSEGNITEAARNLEISRQSLQYKIKKYNLSYK